MKVVRRSYPFILVISILALTCSLVPLGQSSAATSRTLTWSVVDTPSDGLNGMFIRTCGINDLALGPDNRTFYAVSTDNSTPGAAGLFKSTDAGYTWSADIGKLLATAAGLTVPPQYLPVWNIAVAPDDSNFIIAITDNSSTSASGGPRVAFCSTDGGNSWTNAGLLLNTNEYVSCIDISKYDSADQLRDIAIGTRSTTGQGRLLTRPFGTTFSGIWKSQREPPDLLWTAVTSVKFSPNYVSDQTIAVISITAVLLPQGAYLHLGEHVNTSNTTNWDTVTGYTSGGVYLGPFTANSIIRSGIQLPSDYVGTDLTLRSCFVNMFDNTASRVFYVSSTPATFDITPSALRIYSIAYTGTNATGVLLAGEAATTTTRGMANVWQSSNAQVNTPGGATWLKSDTLKSPTGGANTGLANTLLAWSSDGSRAYCGTSSENSTQGGTGTAAGQWPFSKLNKSFCDESAFQYSADSGFTWNQVGIINTEISLLSDVAAVENQDESSIGGGTLYLASINDNTTVSVDSLWRSTSDPLGLLWERTFTLPSSDAGIILRQPHPDASVSGVLTLADLYTANIYYSADSGETWSTVLSSTRVKDISLLNASTLYVLGDYVVRKLTQGGTAWQTVKTVNTNLLAPAHTICNPAKNVGSEELVVVGSEGNTGTGVAWADFSDFLPDFKALKELPMQGNVHVVLDDQYINYKNIYAGIGGIDSTPNTEGTIYRWTVEGGSGRDSLQTSINWDQLEPPDSSFYGVCMLNDVLYGAWNTDTDPPIYSSGADRTLEARVKVPPPPQWDQLIDGLPPVGSPNQVEFTREPTSMHISSNSYNTLWAIDDQGYNFPTQVGCLWQFVDSVAKLGPWPTSPPPNGLIGADPVTGRSQQIDFKWRPLKDIYGYDVLIAKDVNFTLLLTQNLRMTPVDNVTGAWIVTPSNQEDPSCWIAPGVLEVGRSYYWKVRGSRSVMGTPIHSPWSPTLFFSLRPGFMVTSEYMGPQLLAPVDGACSNCLPPMRFSWSPIKNATTYEFTLARDAQLKDVIVQETTSTTAFELKSKLPLSTPYFWQVKAIAPVVSDPSPVGTFTLSEKITQPQKQPAAKTKPGAVPAASNFWIWIIIVIVVSLLLLINAYVFISRRRDS